MKQRKPTNKDKIIKLQKACNNVTGSIQRNWNVILKNI